VRADPTQLAPRVRFGEVQAFTARPARSRPAASVLTALLGREHADAVRQRAGMTADTLDPTATAAAEHQAILAAAEAEAREAGFHAGFAEGHESGLAAGIEEGNRRGAAMIASAVSTLARAVTVLEAKAEEVAVVTENRLAAAAYELATAIVGRALHASPEVAIARLGRALALTPEGETVVRVNPADAATIGELDFGRALTVVPDPQISAGGCLVEVGATIVDSRLDVALDRAREVLCR